MAIKELAPDLLRLIPETQEKGIYYRLYPRKDGTTRLVWWVKVYDRQGRSIYESTDSSRYEDAIRLKKKLISQVETQQRSGGDVDSIRIGQLLDEFMENGTTAKKETRYVYQLVIDTHLKPILGKKRASKLTTDDLLAYRRQRRGELIQRKYKVYPDASPEQQAVWGKSAGATINRELARLRSALEYASKQTPPKIIRIPHFPIESEQENVRKVVLQDSGYATLRDAFSDPGVQLLYVVSSHVGIRLSELKRIQWGQVDLDRKLISLEKGKTKNKDPRSAPIYGDMTEYIVAEKKRHDEFYPESPWVFSRAGQPIKDFREEWHKAVLKAEVPDLHFHDLRRTAQRLMRRAGIDKITRMRIMGHKTDAMDIRYGVVEDEDIVHAGAKLDETFRALMGNHNADSEPSSPAKTGGPTLDPELVTKLATLDSGKVKALLALLSS